MEEETVVAAVEREDHKDAYPWEFDHEHNYANWEVKKQKCLHLSEADIARGPRRGIVLSEYEKHCAVEAHRARRALRRKIEVDAWIQEAEPLAPVELDARWRNALRERATEQHAAERATRLVKLSHEFSGTVGGIDAHMQYMKAALRDTSQDDVARVTTEIADKIGEVADKIGDVAENVTALASATSDVAEQLKDQGSAEAGLLEVAKSVDAFGEMYERLK